jgi:hypothetical protein
MVASKESLHHVLTDMAGQLEGLYGERQAIMKRIAAIKRAITGLIQLSNDPGLAEEMAPVLTFPGPPRKNGLTQACRSILINASVPLTAREVCEKASEHVKHHQDPLASVTTVLNRLVQYGEAELLTDSQASHYVWQDGV